MIIIIRNNTLKSDQTYEFDFLCPVHLQCCELWAVQKRFCKERIQLEQFLETLS